MKRWSFRIITLLVMVLVYLFNTDEGAETYRHIFNSPISNIKKQLPEIPMLSQEDPLSKQYNVNEKELGLPLWGEDSFYSSKKTLKEITRRHPKSFYCGCDIKFLSDSKLVPDFSNCGFHYRKNENRANRMEAEHIVPISWYGHNLKCWQEGGRSNCQKKSDIFNVAEADLVNLQYAIGEVNGDRNYYRYSVWNGGEGQYGSCPAKVDFSGKKFQPREEIRGWIARVHKYMQKKYGVQLSDSQQKLISSWEKLPPTKWECEYNNILKDKYGSKAGNPYTEYACNVAKKNNIDLK